MARQPFDIPTIRGRIAERLARAPARNSDDDPMEFPDAPGDVMLRSAEERGVVALACLLLKNLGDHGGTRVPSRALETLLRRILETFGPKEVMDIEVEVYEILLWIGGAIDDDWQPQTLEDPGTIDPTASQIDLIRWSIAGGLDLEMDYYSRGRGELTHRRITPISLEAETYLHAYCHLRRDERVFRISRIGSLEPVGGWPRKAGASKLERKRGSSPAASQPDAPTGQHNTDEGESSPQMSLLDD